MRDCLVSSGVMECVDRMILRCNALDAWTHEKVTSAQSSLNTLGTVLKCGGSSIAFEWIMLQ